MRQSGTQRLVCLGVCVSASREGYRGIWCWGLAWEEKAESHATPLTPPLHNSCVWLLSGSFRKKKSTLIFHCSKCWVFSPAYPHQGKGSHHQCVRGCNLQGTRTMWKMDVHDGKQTKLPVLFQCCFLSTQWAIWITLRMHVCPRASVSP